MIVFANVTGKATSEELISLVQGAPELTPLTEPITVSFAGFPGVQLDSSARPNPEFEGIPGTDIPPGTQYLPFLSEFFTPGFIWTTSTPEARVRTIVLTVKDQSLLLYLEAPPDEFDQLAADAVTILQSLEWTETSVLASPNSSPTPRPPIPTADFTLAEIVGVWSRSDPERGNLYLTFSEPGTYRASHGTPDGVVHAGAYTLEGRLLTFVDGWDCYPLPANTPGQYVLQVAGGGRWLFLDLYEDECPDRPSALRSVRWTRFVPPSTSTP
jgi:hypothetical protein